MFRSLKLGSVHGIGVYIHWTFWMLMGIYAFSETARNGLAGGVEAAAFIGAVFACVLAHEFGHAAAAAYYGIKTEDITLMIVGGMARLTRIPERPIQEFVIALAGPLVNVVIGLLLFIVLTLGAWVPHEQGILANLYSFTQSLLVANIALVLFNLLPAFPMDGGRVLRSVLAMRQGQLRATETAAMVGRWLALFFVIAAIPLREFSLVLVAGFVYFAGSAELMQLRLRSMQSPDFGASTANPFATFRYSSQPYSPFEPRADRNGEVIDAIEVREVRDGYNSN